ncbi:unnamed protein product [Allacma fusca]|uniref:Peptidase S1 domain-containing protein n=1 Tax=Allacma fusca TaxID=39272 RepID=A0A8J2P2W1_9HEXA|nr:unnamed protein product [Allacma fusca]
MRAYIGLALMAFLAIEMTTGMPKEAFQKLLHTMGVPFKDSMKIFPKNHQSKKICPASSVAPKHAYPHQVSLQAKVDDVWNHFCGGSIIGENKVITTADCAFSCFFVDCRIVAGAHDLTQKEDTQQIRNVNFLKIKLHPDFDGLNYNYAVISTDPKWEYSNAVKPIELATVDPKGKCVASGWGEDEPIGLRHVNLTSIYHSRCKEIYGDVLADHMICAYCNYCDDLLEYGGPMVCDGLLAGIGFYGDPPCGSKEYPAIFTSIAAEREWISSA